MPPATPFRCLLCAVAAAALAVLPAAAAGQVMQAPGTMSGTMPRTIPGTMPGGRPPLPTRNLSAGQLPHGSGHTIGHTAGRPSAAIPAQTPQMAAQPQALTAPSLLDRPAQPARLTLADGKLTVDADNSSLSAILHQLSVSSGMTIDGLGQDQRVFGSYGPGDPRDILSQLLDGAGYNVLMVGRTAEGAPSQLVLTARSSAPPATGPAAVSQPDDSEDQGDNNAPRQPFTPPPPPRPPQSPGPQQNANGTVKSPLQILQELERMRQQQQQQPQQ